MNEAPARKGFQHYPKLITDHTGKRRKVHSEEEEIAATTSPAAKRAPAAPIEGPQPEKVQRDPEVGKTKAPRAAAKPKAKAAK